MWQNVQVGAMALEVASLGVVLSRGDAWSAGTAAPLVVLQVIHAALSLQMGQTTTPDAINSCSSSNRLLSALACLVLGAVPLVWLLVARQSIGNEFSWVLQLVDELEEEQADLPNQGAEEAQALARDGQDAEEGVEEVEWRKQRVGRLRDLLVRRQRIYDMHVPKAVYLAAFASLLQAAYLLYYFFQPPTLLPLCTTYGTFGSLAYPIFKPPSDAGGTSRFLVEMVAPLVMVGLAGIASMLYKAEYKKGRDYRIGWTVQTFVPMNIILLFIPLLLLMGRGAVSLWCTLTATTVLVLAFEPELTRIIMRKIRDHPKFQSEKGHKVLSFFDERESANKTKETWRQMFKGGLFDARTLNQARQAMSQHSGCKRGCCSEPAPVVPQAGPTRMSVEELRAVMDARGKPGGAKGKR